MVTAHFNMSRTTGQKMRRLPRQDRVRASAEDLRRGDPILAQCHGGVDWLIASVDCIDA